MLFTHSVTQKGTSLGVPYQTLPKQNDLCALKGRELNFRDSQERQRKYINGPTFLMNKERLLANR